MSLLHRSVEAFPRGRTTGELLALLDVDFDPRKRAALLAELEGLREAGRVRLGADGRWRAVTRTPLADPPNPRGTAPVGTLGGDVLIPVAGTFTSISAAAPEPDSGASPQFDAAALLRYYRAALRSDPRGATTETADAHGLAWILVTGTGPLVPADGEVLRIALPLDGLPGTFREALSRREANESTLAIGWPMAVTRKAGVPVMVPVGLLPAEWCRSESHLELTVSADDVLLNPDWLRLAARPLGWSEADLSALFATADRSGLPFVEFRARLREAAASAMRGKLDGTVMVSALDPAIAGLHDICALHLPNESTFTAGAVRDLDVIAAWPEEVRRHTALGALFEGMDHRAKFDVMNAAPLNAEQIEAVAHACSAPLTVVTGPPGTGKSQAITAMAASVLMAGGSVLVASKNHQALDAVEDRLGSMAPDIGFLVRTLDPARELDNTFRDTLRTLLKEPTGSLRLFSADDLAILSELAARRMRAVENRALADELRCELADVIERIALRNGLPSAPLVRLSWFQRIIRQMFLGSRLDAPLDDNAGLAQLQGRRDALSKAIASIDTSLDPVALTEEVARRVTGLLPIVLGTRTALSDTDRRAIGNANADLELAGATIPLSRELADAVLCYRPLWLASILGTPKRIPLEPALFDLVIFDEASQCDIASALPLLARAKRAVVVGDDRQLSFIAQLGIAQDRNLMKAQNLEPSGLGRYAQSRRSLFDLASLTDGAARVLLRDQYRSAPEIVGYISDQFYGGKLRPAGDPDRFQLPRGARPGLAWTDVPAPPTPQRGNVNPAEVVAIVAHLRLLLLEQDYAGSIGVIAPFRPQVGMLMEAIRAAVPDLRLEAAEFRVSTVDGFQGQERDLILFSPVIGPSAAASDVQFVQKDWRRMNVAISRARAVAHVFGDLAYARSGKVDSLRKLAARATEPRVSRSNSDVFDSDWERRVYHALKERGLDPVPQYEIAGRRLDFALFGQSGINLDLEVDGRLWHSDSDGRRKRSDLWRDHQLRSLGWRVRRFWVDELSNDLEGCLDIIERDLA